jgi:hypothetical protein
MMLLGHVSAFIRKAAASLVASRVDASIVTGVAGKIRVELARKQADRSASQTRACGVVLARSSICCCTTGIVLDDTPTSMYV